MSLEPILRRTFNEPDRAQAQESVARAVETDPERFIERYRRLEQSLSARYVSADLFKETFEIYSASNATRHRYNACVHNAAAVLASEYLRRAISTPEPGRDTVILLTGIPGAGKTSSVLEAGELPGHIRAVYEGQLSDPATAIGKVQQVLDGGLKPVVLAVHVKPEKALENTLQRFCELGRGAGIGVMAVIQGNLPESLQRVHERFGERVALQIIDRRVFHESKVLDGWQHLAVLESEGHHEQIRSRLAEALEQHRNAGRLELDAYAQALGLAPRSTYPELDRSARARDDAHGEERSRTPENRPETLLTTPPASELTATERLRQRSDEVAARLAAEREQGRAAREALESARAQEKPHELAPASEQKQQLEHGLDHDLET
ncbi:MAG: hypothetical protein ACRETH_00570 [Steroidobacteraceae bacterium]